MSGRIHQWASATAYLCIVAFSGDVERCLLHVGPPIDLSVCRLSMWDLVSPLFGCHLQGTFQMISPHSTISANNNSGHTHRVCRGSCAMARPFRTRSMTVDRACGLEDQRRTSCGWLGADLSTARTDNSASSTNAQTAGSNTTIRGASIYNCPGLRLTDLTCCHV